MTRTEILPQIFKLSPPDQLMIAEAIRNHLTLTPLDETEFKAELERSQAEADADPSSVAPLADVMERLRAR